MYSYQEIKKFVDNIKSNIKGINVVGSYKRKEQEIDDLDIVTRNKKIIAQLIKLYPDIKIQKQGDYYVQLKLNNLYIDIWFASDKEELKALKIIRSIDSGHNIAYRKLARKMGLLLNDKGLFKDNIRINFNNEKELRQILNIV